MKPLVRTLLIAILLFTITSSAVIAQETLPNPILIFAGAEYYTTNGTPFVRYKYNVVNSQSYPSAVFAASPALPPCGANANSARTWVDINDQRGKKLNGFCALRKGDDLNSIWFAAPADEVPPSWIYIEMNDRQTGRKFKSNLAETTM